MIVQERGRWRTERTPTETAAATRDLIGDLSPEERLAFDFLLKDMATNKGPSILVDDIARAEWREVPVPIEEWLDSKELIGDNSFSLYPKLKEDMIRLFRGNYHEVLLCLHPETRVPLLDGSTPTIESLAQRWSADPTPFWVYGVLNGKIVPALAHAPRQTGVDDYFRVRLDDGTTFTGNARHQMVLRDGSKRMIQDLHPGDSLMPFDVRLSGGGAKRGLRGYEQVRDPSSGEWVFTHRIVAAAECARPTADAGTIHHCNFNKLDNRPDNLRWMRFRDHSRMHGEHIRQLNLNGQASRAGKLAWTNRSPEAKRAFGVMMSQRNKSMGDHRLDVTMDAIQKSGATNINEAAEILDCSPTRVRRVLAANGETQVSFFGNRRGKRRGKKDTTLDAVVRAVQSGSKTIAAVAARLNCAESTVRRLLNKEDVRWRDICGERGNHFVVEIVACGRGPVFCMTVPTTANFAVSTGGKEVPTRSGVFSSNTGSIGWG